jgi:hypothetical protein
VPGIQATAAAVVPTVATVVAGVVQSEQTQEAVRQLATLLGGVRLDVDQTPPGAAPPDTTRLVLRGSDAAGGLARLEPFARQLAGQAALATAGQLFPNAAIELTVADASGAVMLRGSRQPGYQPEVVLAE